jgi:hypothetical protein
MWHAQQEITHLTNYILYREFQEERSVFWEVIVAAILSKNLNVHVSYSERFPR